MIPEPWKRSYRGLKGCFLRPQVCLSSSPCRSSLEDWQKLKSWELSRAYFLSQDSSFPVSPTCLYSEHRHKDQPAKKEENKGDFLSDFCRLPWPTLALKPIPGVAPTWFSLHLHILVRNSSSRLLCSPWVWIFWISLDSFAVFAPDLMYCEIPEEAAKAIREAIFKSALAFFMAGFNSAATEQVSSFELPGGLLQWLSPVTGWFPCSQKPAWWLLLCVPAWLQPSPDKYKETSKGTGFTG